MQAYEVGYASLVIAGMRNILVLDEPATAKDVEEASREPFQSSRAEVVELPEDGGKILAAKHVTVTGYDLEEGLCFLPWSNRNVWKILSLRPELAAHVFTFATDPENFPEMPDPLASRRSGKTGAKSTSSTETPPGEGSKSPKRAGKPRSSRKSS